VQPNVEEQARSTATSSQSSNQPEPVDIVTQTQARNLEMNDEDIGKQRQSMPTLRSLDVQIASQRPSKEAAIMIPGFAVTWYLFARVVKIVPKSRQKGTKKQSKKDLSAVAGNRKDTEKQSER